MHLHLISKYKLQYTFVSIDRGGPVRDEVGEHDIGFAVYMKVLGGNLTGYVVEYVLGVGINQ